MSDCEKLVQFDTVAVSSSFASTYSALQFVTEENYDEMKQSLGFSVSDYFDGDWRSFSSKRSKMSRLLALAGMTSINQDYYRHTLSSEGAKAYAMCIAQQGNKILSAWVETQTEDRVSIGVHCGFPGEGNAVFTLSGERPVDAKQEYTLKAQGTMIIIFEHNPRRSFLLAINGTFNDQADASASLFLPPVRNIEKRRETRKVTATVRVAAGGFGNTSANRVAIPAKLVAPDGFYLLPDSLVRTEWKVVGGPGVRAAKVTATSLPFNGSEEVTAISLDPVVDSIDGNDGDRQGTTDLVYECSAYRDYLVDVDPIDIPKDGQRAQLEFVAS